MRDIEKISSIFNRYGGIMRARDLAKEKVFYADIIFLTEKGYIEKVRTGFYRWINGNTVSEAAVVTTVFPDAVLCMETALYYYGYSDRAPADWHIAVDKYSCRSRFRGDYPSVKVYYVAPALLELGLCSFEIDGVNVRMYDKERVICDCLRHRNRMNKEVFSKAIREYISDSSRNVPKLLEYAEKLKCLSLVKNMVEVWM